VTRLRRGDVVIADLSIAVGSELKKTRPAVVVSPDVINGAGVRYLIVPMTRGSYPYRYRVPCRFKEQTGHVILDEVRVIDASLVSGPIGSIPRPTVSRVLAGLRQMFEE
jgi:mRNA interferase MazF